MQYSQNMIYYSQIEDSGIIISNNSATRRVGSLTASSIYPKGGVLFGGRMHKTHGECIKAVCLNCGADFSTAKRYLRRGRGRYCSIQCTSQAGGRAGKIWQRFTKRALNHELRKLAYYQVTSAVKSGILKKKPCEICGEKMQMGIMRTTQDH